MTHYIDLRYKWTPKEIKTQLNTAKAFILPKNLKAFETASVNLTKFAIEKGVTQRIFPETISVSIPNKTVRVLGDRITSIQGLKAAADLKLEFTIESGERTKENPWGIYITKEREE
jgi:hypothetical protein